MTKHPCTAERSHCQASGWVQRYLPTLAGDAVSAPVLLDWACGQGRHSLLALDRGWQVLAVDKDPSALERLREQAQEAAYPNGLHCFAIDLERPDSLEMLRCAALDLGVHAMDALVVTNYLYRLHWRAMMSLLRPGGLLLYETFADGQQQLGRPRRGSFLLQAGELLAKAQQSNLAIFAFEDVVERDERSQPIARVQRLYARKVDPVSGADPWLG